MVIKKLLKYKLVFSCKFLTLLPCESKEITFINDNNFSLCQKNSHILHISKTFGIYQLPIKSYYHLSLVIRLYF